MGTNLPDAAIVNGSVSAGRGERSTKSQIANGGLSISDVREIIETAGRLYMLANTIEKWTSRKEYIEEIGLMNSIAKVDSWETLRG